MPYRDISLAPGPSFEPHLAIYQAIVAEINACTIIASDSGPAIDLIEYPNSASLATQPGYYTLGNLVRAPIVDGNIGSASDAVYFVTQSSAMKAKPSISVVQLYGSQSPKDPARETLYVGVYCWDDQMGDSRSVERMQVILKKLLHNNQMPTAQGAYKFMAKTQERGPHLVPGFGLSTYIIMRVEVRTNDFS